MAEEQKIDLYELGTLTSPENIIFSGDRESVRNKVGNTAFELNCGIYRYWEKDGRYYYDCGPVTYYTKEPIWLELPSGTAEENSKKAR